MPDYELYDKLVAETLSAQMQEELLNRLSQLVPPCRRDFRL